MFNKGMEIPVVLFEDEGKGGGSKPEHDEHLQQAIRERDEAKAKAKRAEEFEAKANDLQSKLQAIEDAKKIEAGEFQKLADDYKKKLDEVNPEIERLKKIEADHTEYITNRKKTILESIPEDKRTDWQDADLKTLEKVAPLYNTGNILGTDNGKGGKVIITTNRTWDDFTMTELDELEKSNKSEYERLYNQKYKKKVFAI